MHFKRNAHVIQIVQPFVAAELSKICQGRWARARSGRSSELVLEAAPLPRQPNTKQYLFNEWPRDLVRIRVTEGGNLIASGQGIIRRVQVDVVLDVSFGVKLPGCQEWWEPVGVKRAGFLCEAGVRQDSREMWVKLQTSLGTLWVQSAKGQRPLPEQLLEARLRRLIHPPALRVVHMIVSSSCEAIRTALLDKCSPWEGLEARNPWGTRWKIAGGRFDFSAQCYLQAQLPSDESKRLRRRAPRLVLEPPYHAVWEPKPGVFIPFELR